MIDLKANKKLIKHHLIASTGKKVTLKDNHNVGRSLKSNMNNLASVVAELRNIESSENAPIEILVDESDTIQGIYLQSKEMIDTFVAFPKILFVDATYKFNDNRMPLYVLMVEDSNGESEIICFFR